MFVTKIKSALAVVLVVAALAGAAGLIYQTQAAEPPKAKEDQPASRNDRKERQPPAAVPAPDDGEPNDLYFPTREGTRRVYEQRARGATYEHTEAVTKVEKQGASFRVTTGQEVAPGWTLKTVTDVSATGVSLVEFAGKVHADPIPLLKLPAKAGDSWTAEHQIPTGGMATFTYTVGKVEEVEVPAGKFKAIRVEAKTDALLQSATRWYAPGVGLVKAVSTFGKNEQTQVLKSYTSKAKEEQPAAKKDQKQNEEKPAQPKPQPAKTDQERMVGNWFITNDDSLRKGEMWVFTEADILMNAKNTSPMIYRYAHRLDAGKEPRQIDITVSRVNGPAVGIIKGIYALDGDELRLCLGEMGKDRPTEFAGKAGQSEFLILHSGDPAAERRKAAKEEKLRVLIDQVLAAHGGEGTLNKLQFTMTVKHSNGETQHYFVQPPTNFRWETTHRDRTGKRIVILFPERRRWWTQEPNEAAMEFIPTGLEPMSLEGWRDYVNFFGPRQVLRLKDADHKVALLDEEATIGGRAAVGVQVTGPRCNQKMYFDKETHLLVKGYGVNLREATYSDYKTFDGIPIARKENDGHFMPEVTDFRAVEKLDAKLFERP